MNMVAMWVRTSEAARQIGLHPNRMREIPPEVLPYMVINQRGDRRYRRDELERYVEERMVRTSCPKGETS